MKINDLPFAGDPLTIPTDNLLMVPHLVEFELKIAYSE